jgi:hypothetical protein
MIDTILMVSITANVVLATLYLTKSQAKVLAIESKVHEPPAPGSHVAQKPFRTRKAFRELKRSFEDAHDPQRMSQRRVERFGKDK